MSIDFFQFFQQEKNTNTPIEYELNNKARKMSKDKKDKKDKPKQCENIKCATSETPLWRYGWKLGDGKRRARLCNACGLRFQKGNYCQYCFEIFKDVHELASDKRQWIRCETCEHWAHKSCAKQCDDLNGENDEFRCPKCNEHSIDLKPTLVAQKAKQGNKKKQPKNSKVVQLKEEQEQQCDAQEKISNCCNNDSGCNEMMQDAQQEQQDHQQFAQYLEQYLESNGNDSIAYCSSSNNSSPSGFQLNQESLSMIQAVFQCDPYFQQFFKQLTAAEVTPSKQVAYADLQPQQIINNNFYNNLQVTPVQQQQQQQQQYLPQHQSCVTPPLPQQQFSASSPVQGNGGVLGRKRPRELEYGEEAASYIPTLDASLPYFTPQNISLCDLGSYLERAKAQANETQNILSTPLYFEDVALTTPSKVQKLTVSDEMALQQASTKLMSYDSINGIGAGMQKVVELPSTVAMLMAPAQN